MEREAGRMERIGVLGGDRRQAELARLLERAGWQVDRYGLTDWPGTEADRDRALGDPAVVLPLPLCREDGTVNWPGEPWTAGELLERLRPGQRVLAGQVSPEVLEAAAARGVRMEDYFQREALTVANAAITAEGAVQTALEHLEGTLLGRNCLVLGFGRIGRLLSARLQGMGARVTAAARSPADRAWARAYGYGALPAGALDGNLGGFGAVFNTVPALLLDESLLSQLPGECLVVDLASRPGVDRKAARDRGLSYVWARGIPGRLAPRAAAEALRDAVEEILKGG